MNLKLKPDHVTQVPISKLRADPHQPRQTFDKASLTELAESLKAGVEIPLKVRADGVVVDGERRLRAAKIAGIKSLPCLLDARTDELALSAAQLTTSAQREQLGPMDIAEFLVGLQKRQKKSMTELAAALAKRGIKQIGHSKLTQYIRLTELPKWAQGMLRAGTLSESAAYEILPAVGLPDVLETVEESVHQAIDYAGSVIAKEVRDDVATAMIQHGINLHQKKGKPEEIRAFPLAPCHKCDWFRRVGATELCFNAKEFAAKQANALALVAQKDAEAAAAEKKSKSAGSAPPAVDPTDPKAAPPRTLPAVKSLPDVVNLQRVDRISYEALVDAKFDKTECQTCPHRRKGAQHKIELDYCFFVPCFHRKSDEARKDKNRDEKLAEYLDKWLRPRLGEYIQQDIKLNDRSSFHLRLVLWLASGLFTIRHNGGYVDRRIGPTGNAGEAWLKQWRLRNYEQLFDLDLLPDAIAVNTLAGHALFALAPTQLRFIAQLRNFPIETYRIDADYLALKRRPGLLELANIAGVPIVNGMSVGEIKALLLEADAVEKIGCPNDIARAYSAPRDDMADPADPIFEEDEDGEVDNALHEAAGSIVAGQE